MELLIFAVNTIIVIGVVSLGVIVNNIPVKGEE